MYQNLQEGGQPEPAHQSGPSCESAKVFCKVCWKCYQTQTFYKAHLKNNQCYPRDMDEIPEEELAQIQKELEEEEDDIEVMDQSETV